MAALSLALAACAALPTAPTEVREAVSADLGPPVMPLVSGVYALDGLDLMPTTPSEDPERPFYTSHVVLQANHPSQSYGMFLHNIRFYGFDDEFLVMEVYRLPDDAVFLLARVGEDGRSFKLLPRNCSQLPENFRVAQDISTSDCHLRSARTVLRSLALMEAREDEVPIPLVLVQDLPDLP